MPTDRLPDSFEPDASKTATATRGQRAHRDLIAHTDRFRRTLWTVRPGVWCLVGNGLSNQTFVEGPEGLVVIDTGESVEEMAAALAEVRAVSRQPVAAVIYSHFHYVAGTRALLPVAATSSLPIWGHAGIVGNRQRMGTEVSAAASRGLVHQFGVLLPEEGEDGLVNVGLGLEFRSRSHAPFTPGFVAPTHTFTEATRARIAGLDVELTPAPSDADDSITIWFPALGVCVDNLVWPTLFNVFAIRGEEYRDPRRLLTGMDHILALRPQHLVGAHGPPLSGESSIREEVTRYRDAIQFLWDQTVRGINRGLTLGELASFVRLPALYSQSYLTRQFYGLVEHHVKQIHAGLRGWFDGDEAALLPLPPLERARRLIDGFGGADEVRRRAEAALTADDLRWALELATWLVRSERSAEGRADGGTTEDRARLARVLRTIAQRTTSANVRNWCITRARELDGLLDLSRFRVHRITREQVLGNAPAATVHVLRVLLDPERASGIDATLRWRFEGGAQAGLHVRNAVAVPTDGEFADARAADFTLSMSIETWAQLVSGKRSLTDAVGADAVRVDGDLAALKRVLACFDHLTLAK